MKTFIVYCHPSENSFTKSMCDAFIKGVVDSGNEYILSDLYKMGFQTDMTEEEYQRDAYYRDTPDVADDVLAEQEKINSSDAIVFIYPVFWTEAPAKLVGWFDRVWSYGFAYGEKTMKVLDKAVILDDSIDRHSHHFSHLVCFGHDHADGCIEHRESVIGACITIGDLSLSFQKSGAQFCSALHTVFHFQHSVSSVLTGPQAPSMSGAAAEK